MNLSEIIVKVLNIDIIKAKNGKEYFKLQGYAALNDKQKEKILCGEYQTVEIFEEWNDEFEQICAECKKIDKVHLQGYFNNGFRLVSIGQIEYKKEK